MDLVQMKRDVNALSVEFLKDALQNSISLR